MKTYDDEIIQLAQNIIKHKFRHTQVREDPVRELYKLCVVRKIKDLDGIEPDKRNLIEESLSAKKPLSEAEIIEPADVNLTHLVKKNIDLPSLPSIFTQIVKIMSDPYGSTKHFADVISKDPALSARLLKLVNSAYYGFPSKITTISRAITIIGTKELYALTLGMSVITMFKDIPEELVNMTSFWKHSVTCGVMARIIASQKEYPDTEKFFVGGLLHDIGRLVQYKYFSQYSKLALIYADQVDGLLFEAEKKIMGVDHTEIGGVLLEKWKLPEELEQMIMYHHNAPDLLDNLSIAIVHIADIIVNALELGSSGEKFVPPMDMGLWNVLGISHEDLKAIIELAEPQAQGIMDALVIP